MRTSRGTFPHKKNFESKSLVLTVLLRIFAKNIVFDDDVIAENVVENVYRQLPPPKTLWEIWKEKSKPLFLVTERPKVIATTTDLEQCSIATCLAPCWAQGTSMRWLN